MPKRPEHYRTEYAECHKCGQTTDPDADVMGIPNPGDTVVEQTEDGAAIFHASCAGEGRSKRLEDYM